MYDESGREPQLRSGSVGLFGDFIGAITNVAPTLDVGFTLGPFLLAVGFAGPSAIVIAGAAMLCISIGYARMNRLSPNAGAGVRWLQPILPALGFAMGLIVILMMIFILIGNLSLAGSTLLALFSSHLATIGWLEWIVGSAVTILAIVVGVIGVQAQVRFQGIIVILEYAVLFICAISILVAHGLGNLAHVPSPSLSWLSPTSAGGKSITPGIVIAVFALAGWENPIYLAEEQRNARKDPGRGAALGVIWGTVIIAFLMIAFQSAAPSGQLAAHGATVLSFATGRVLGGPWPALISVALLSSLVGATQANLSNGARTAFKMSYLRILPGPFGKVSRKQQTPYVSLIVIGGLSVVVGVLYATSTSVVSVLDDITSTVGYLYILVYVTVALVAVWWYRKSILKSFTEFVVGAVLPLAGCAVLGYAWIKAVPTAGMAVIIPTVAILAGSILVGLVLQFASPVPFFRRRIPIEDPDSSFTAAASPAEAEAPELA